MSGFPPKLTKLPRLMSASETSGNRLNSLIQQLQQLAEAEAIHWPSIVETAEELLLESHVQHFLSERQARLVELDQKLHQRLVQVPELTESAKETPSPTAPQERQAPISVEDSLNAHPLGREVKVLPDPEGPPVFRKPSPETPSTEPLSTAAAEKPGQAIQPQANVHWKLGLNDRIALTQHLFDGNAEDLQRVLSQMETMDHFDQARDFLLQMVQPDYNWSKATEHVERLLDLTEAWFQHRPK